MKRSLRFLACLLALSAVAQEPLPPPVVPPPQEIPAPPDVTLPPGAARIAVPRGIVSPAAPPTPAFPGAPSSVPARPARRNPVVLDNGEQVSVELHRAQNSVEALLKTETLYSRGTRPTRTLVIPEGESEPATISHVEEDLTIMSRLLEKSVPRYRDDGGKVAMGIAVDSSVLSPSSLVRNVYLEGYGALFILRVRMPLVAPAQKSDEPKPKEAASTDWDAAKEEIYGAANSFDPDVDRNAYRVIGGAGGVEYDAQKVEELKNSLLEALKNATHIRHVKPTEWITVAVMGNESISLGRLKQVRLASGNNNVGASGKGSSDLKLATSHGESTLTIRVKKSDVDEFAKGKLTLEQFREKATVNSYLRPQAPVPGGKTLVMPEAR